MSAEFQGVWVSGTGDPAWLSLLEDSFAMLNGSPVLPSLAMLYKPEWDTFREGFIWDGWWIQNSYGFTLGALPFLSAPYDDLLQRSFDLFWSRIGDGVRLGRDSQSPGTPPDCFDLVAPDGALGDAVLPEGIVYKQGDGEFHRYDWFYEATAAMVCTQAQFLLFRRDLRAVQQYLPLIRRSLDHIERTRDATGLFLVGPSCNLLAPSFGAAWNAETGEIERSYLCGLAVTYIAALRAAEQVACFAGNAELEADFAVRRQQTEAQMHRFLTPGGYFAKSLEQDGTLHGVYGAAQYGYFESSCNVDAVAHGVAQGDTAERIMRQIAAIPVLRPAGLLCANAPHLDDTYRHYLEGHRKPHALGYASGDWVDGGCWATVEGRAILAYCKTGRFPDAFRAASVYMDWARLYRQDAPMAQWGHNTANPWAHESPDRPGETDRPVAVMVDNFAPVTCLLRGLFAYEADAYGLRITPQLPPEISVYAQRHPVQYAGLSLTLHYRAGHAPAAVFVNNTPISGSSGSTVYLPAALLEVLAEDRCVSILIDCTGNAEPAPMPPFSKEEPADLSDLPPALQAYIQPLRAGHDPATNAVAERMLALAARRRAIPLEDNARCPMTAEKRAQIYALYTDAARAWCDRALRR